MGEMDDDEYQGQIELWDTTFAFAKSMALKAAVLLGIPDVIASKGPDAMLSIEEIAAAISAQNTDFLFRILRFLVRIKIFSEKDSKYGLTRASKWLVRTGNKHSFAPLAIMQLDECLQAPWHHFHECVLEGKDDAFGVAHGKDVWKFAAENPWFNNLFNDAMVSSSMVVTQGLLKHYQGFDNINRLVDVGGGLGLMISKIVEAYPNIKAINYDLPHVVAKAPSFPGVEHIEGDMFQKVPSADAIIMKWIMHDWDDDNCTKILRNCAAALPDNGKLIIVDTVLEEEIDPLNNVRMAFDLLMIAHTVGGRERTRAQWHSLLNRAGFPVVNIYSIPSLQSVIEAFKQ